MDGSDRERTNQGAAPRSRATAGRAPWIAVLVLALLVVGVGLALREAGVLRGAAPGGRAPQAPAPGDRVIEQALRPAAGAAPGAGSLTPQDSAALKHRWVEEVRGVEAGGLDARQKERFLRFANARECTCGCGYTLAGCKASDMTCEVSGAALSALLDSIRAGRVTGARGIRARPRGGA